MFLSIITPSYNRAYILRQCYESLVAQTDKDFEWILIDDGSTDDTEALALIMQQENRIRMTYIKQVNGGKHIAHNTGVLHAKGELVVCLDSDDRLTEDAVETAKRYWAEHAVARHTGILAKRGNFETREPICGTWPSRLSECTMFDLTNKYGFKGDTVLFFRREILADNLFKCFENEKFIPETNLYIDVDTYGTMLLLDRVLYLCAYLPDGLTAKFHKLLRENPNGTADTYYKSMCMATSLKTKVKYAVLTNIYLSLSANRRELRFTRHRVLLLLCKIPARLIKRKFLNRFTDR